MDGRLEEGVVVGDRVQIPEVNVSLNDLHFECCSASVGILTDAGRCRAGWLQQRLPRRRCRYIDSGAQHGETTQTFW